MKRYVTERGSDRLRALVRRSTEIAVARISFAETCAAFARAARAGRLDDAAASRAMDALSRDFTALRVVEVRRAIIDATRGLVVRWPLRAYDAVQLACALKLFTAGAAIDFWCAEATLAAAARGEGMRATLVE